MKGIGPTRASLLETELGLHTAADLLRHYPTAYLDRSKTHTIRSLHDDATDNMPHVQVRGRFVAFNVLGEGAKMRLGGCSPTVQPPWNACGSKGWAMRRACVPQRLYRVREAVVFQPHAPDVAPRRGLPSTVNRRRASIHGVYPHRKGFANVASIPGHRFRRAPAAGLPRHPLPKPLPQSVVESQGLMSLDSAIRNIHIPTTPRDLSAARERLKFEELFLIQTDTVMRARRAADRPPDTSCRTSADGSTISIPNAYPSHSPEHRNV